MKRNLPLILTLPSLGLALFCLLAPTVAHAVGGSGPFFDSGVVVGTASSSSLPEISGVAVSTQNSDVLWVNNDGNNPAEIYALGTNGTLLGTYTLDGVGTNIDWEDIAIGPGPVSGVDYLYIADTGDNSPSRSFVTIYRVREPDVNVIPSGTLTGVEALHVKYPNTKYDCETLLVDLNGDIVMVTRDRANDEDNNVIDAVSHVFSYPASQQAPQAVGATPAPFTLIENVSSTLSNTWDIKGGDVSRDGSWVILRPSEGGEAVDGMLWIRSPGTSLSDVFADPFCLVPLAGEPQGEAVSFNADGSGYYTISEGNNQPIYFYAENNNTPPDADSSFVSTDEDTSLTITLTALDAELDSLTYAIVSGPTAGTLSVISGDQVTYSPDLNFNGTDSFTFVANDGTANSAVATVIITVSPVDDAPLALAGSNQSVSENVLVDLDGSGSFDPDGDPLTSYAWTQDSGPTVLLSDSGAAQPSFIAPAVSQDTTLVFSLVVSDGTLPSAADTVSVTVSPLSYDAFVSQEPTVNYGVVTGAVDATSSADDNGQVQTVTEVRSGSKGRKRLEVEYVLQTIAPPTSIVSLELNLIHAWTERDSPGESLEAFVWNSNIDVLDWEDISGMLLDTGVFAPSGSPADYVDGNQSIRIQFRDSAEIPREKADTLSIDSLWANIEVGTPDTEPPAAPTSLAGTAGEFEVNLDWDANAESDLLGYFVYRSATESDEYTALNIDPVSGSAFQDATVNAATTYYYVVTAIDISGNESGDSTIVTVTTTDEAPSTPANLTATEGDQLVTVDWDDNTETDLAGYNVYRSDVTGPLNGATPIAGNGVVDTGLSNGTSYSYFVTAVDTLGNESGFTAAVSATPTATAEQFLHVESIDMTVTRKGKNWKAEASVLVTDQSGNPLAGATVTGDWSYETQPNSSGTVAVTDASGFALLTSSPEKANSGDVFEFSVTGVALDGFTYDSDSSVTADFIVVGQ